MKTITCILLPIVLFLSACEKYPEGGIVHGLSGTEERIAGFYSIDAWMVNQLDSTAFMQARFAGCGASAFGFTRVSNVAKFLECACVNLPKNSWEADSHHLRISFSFSNDAQEVFPLICNKNVT